MLSPLRNRFGIPGVISVIALVFAMLGGAYAASKDGGGKATASAKAKKGPRGPRGKIGPAGPAGAAGPAGPAGPQGPAGANGKDGSNGSTGAKGATGANGTNGSKGATGATGATGPTGETGFTDTLPSGKTETGVWAVNQVATEEFFEAHAPISFTIPLKDAGAENSAFLFSAEKVENEEFGLSGCQWELEVPEAQPEATKPGTLCVFTQGGELFNITPPTIRPPGAFTELAYGPAGAVLAFPKDGSKAIAEANVFGVWAVTAP